MTDRINAITLVLGDDIREDDAQALLAACRQLRGVIDVRPNATDGTSDFVAMSRAKATVSELLVETIRKVNGLG